VLNDPDDRMIMVFDLGDDDVYTDNFGGDEDNTNAGVRGDEYFGDEVPEGSSVNVKITTKSGATTTEQLTVPETLSGESAVQL
jgi:flagellin FlaB